MEERFVGCAPCRSVHCFDKVILIFCLFYEFALVEVMCANRLNFAGREHMGAFEFELASSFFF